MQKLDSDFSGAYETQPKTRKTLTSHLVVNLAEFSLPLHRLDPQLLQPGLSELKVPLIVRQGRDFLLQRRLDVVLLFRDSGQRLLGSARRILRKLKGRLMRVLSLLQPSLQGLGGHT